MKRSLLPRAGKALYGASWKAPLARDLKISTKTLARYEAGDRRVPDEVATVLGNLLNKRLAVITGLCGQFS